MRGVLISPDQSPEEMPVNGLQVTQDTLAFSVPKIGGSFRGKRNAEGAFAGEWTQGALKLPLALAETDPRPLSRSEVLALLAGRWLGSLDTGNGKLRFVLRIERSAGNQELVPLLDSPDQGGRDVPVTAITMKDRTVTFESESIGGAFRGDLDSRETTMQGTWLQLGKEYPLTLKKAP
jgi:hypothetical protein